MFHHNPKGINMETDKKTVAVIDEDGNPIGDGRYVIEFAGRTMAVQQPKADQLAQFQLTSKQLAQLKNAQNPSAQEVMRALERGQAVLSALLADRQDREWLEDRLMDGSKTLADLYPIIELATAAWSNRAGRRAGAKAAKKSSARRKA